MIIRFFALWCQRYQNPWFTKKYIALHFRICHPKKLKLRTVQVIRKGFEFVNFQTFEKFLSVPSLCSFSHLLLDLYINFYFNFLINYYYWKSCNNAWKIICVFVLLHSSYPRKHFSSIFEKIFVLHNTSDTSLLLVLKAFPHESENRIP